MVHQNKHTNALLALLRGLYNRQSPNETELITLPAYRQSIGSDACPELPWQQL